MPGSITPPVLFVLLALAGRAPPAPTSADCLACHESVTVDASVHGPAGVECMDCHADVKEVPHPDRLAPATCATCHDAATAEHAVSVHATQKDGRPLASCATCHGAHDIRPRADPASPANHLRVAETCGRCHSGMAGSRGAIPGAFADSIHGKALSEAGLVVAPTCSTCHAAHAVRRNEDPESKVHRKAVAGTCGACHAGILAPFATSVHAQPGRDGLPRAVCSDCHSAHAITSPGQPAWRLEVVGECGECHEESIRTYRDTFHGQVTSLGFTRVATCADCHSAHDVLPESDPRSTIAPGGLVQTCARCHPGANQNFVKYDPHADVHDDARAPALYVTARLMEALLASVFAFFAVHTALWFPRSLRDRLRAHAPAPPPVPGPPAPPAAEDDGQRG